MDDVLTVMYKGMFFKVSSHNIINLMTVITNIYPGTYIESFIQDDLNIKQDEHYIYINDDFYMPDDILEDLITVLNQANGIIYSVLTIPKEEDENIASDG